MTKSSSCILTLVTGIPYPHMFRLLVSNQIWLQCCNIITLATGIPYPFLLILLMHIQGMGFKDQRVLGSEIALITKKSIFLASFYSVAWRLGRTRIYFVVISIDFRTWALHLHSAAWKKESYNGKVSEWFFYGIHFSLENELHTFFLLYYDNQHLIYKIFILFVGGIGMKIIISPEL